MKRTWSLAVLTLTLLVGAPRGDVLARSAPSATAGASLDAAYAYGTPAFDRLVRESYAGVQAGTLLDFGTWLARAYASTKAARLPGHERLSLADALAARQAELAAATSASRRTQLQRDTAAWLHTAVKAMIPKFSLDRGFEFANTVRLGERQCLLQSVLIAALLQRLGMDAGAAMVWRNEKGVESNLGHVTAVVRLANGHDLLVDASDPQPFMRHQGLFVRVRAGATFAYRFVLPHYGERDEILGYQDLKANRRAGVADTRPLAFDYVRSQFDYYRGERAPSGFLGKSTRAGLALSERFLTRATKLGPDNPLAALVLGHVYRKAGDERRAKAQYERAWTLYDRSGFVPPSAHAAVQWARRLSARPAARAP